MTGTIKIKTPKFKLIIPLFNIATWHDYIEENFRTIDALFYNLFDIQNFKGAWKNVTEYIKNDVVFIPEDYEVDENGELIKDEYGDLIQSKYSGRMVKVLIDHTTDNSEYFSQYLYKHQDYYEFFIDASTSQMFAQEAKTAATESQEYANNAQSYAENAETFAINSQNSANISEGYALNAKEQAQLSANNVQEAQNFVQDAEKYAQKAEEYAQLAQKFRVLTNITVPTSAWVDNDSETYKKKVLISIDNVTSQQIVDVYFGEVDAISGNFSPITNSVDGGVYIYSKNIPTSSLLIPSILIFK